MPDNAPAVFRVWIDATPETVWNEITRTDAPIAAFFNNKMHLSGALQPGSRLAMRTANGKWTGVVGEILEVVPHSRFAHTFKFTAYDDPECTVIYELEPLDGGTQFTLIVEDLPTGTKTGKNMSSGGTMICNTLKRVVETGRPSAGIRVLYALFKVMGPLSPRRCATKHWPLDGSRAATSSKAGGGSR